MVYIIHQLENNFMDQNQSFFNKNKKYIIIASMALIIFISVFYFLFFYKKISGENIQKPTNLSSLSGILNNIFTNNNDDNTNSEVDEENNNEYYFESLIKIWDKPVAGYGFYYKEYSYEYTDVDNNTSVATDTASILIFIDSDSGDIYEKNLLEPTSTAIKIAETGYKDIRKAYFLNDKNNFKSRIIFQYSDKENIIKTINAAIPSYYGNASKILNINNLPEDITNISISEDQKKLAFVVKNSNTNDISSDWYILSAETSNYGKKIYHNELSEWKLNINNNNQIFAYNSESSKEKNNLYTLKNNILYKIYSGHTGQSFLINEAFLLTSIFTNDGIKTYIKDNFIGSIFNDKNLEQLKFSTLSDKCILVSKNKNMVICSVPKEQENYDSGLPDAWYQGLTSFNDNLYIAGGDYISGELLFDFNIDGNILENIDIKYIKTNKFYTHLVFINKNDFSLWSINIDNILNVEGD